jgi:tape measure domain-containing protein
LTVAGRLEYVIDLSDAAAYAKLQRWTNTLQTTARQHNSAFSSMGTAADTAGRQVEQGMSAAGNAIDKHGKHMRSTLEMVEWRLKYMAISSTIYAGKLGIGAITAAFTASAVAGFQFNSMMERSTIAFNNMLGSAGAAADMLGRLYSLSLRSPMEFGQFVTGAQRLIAYGVAAENVERTLRAIGDATAAVGGSNDVFTRMSFSIGQMVSQGKITAREMRELAMAGIPAWELLAEAIGKTIAEARHLSETTGIDADIGIPALLSKIEERFGGMMEQMDNTMDGLKSTAIDLIKQTMGAAEEGLFEDIKYRLMDFRQWMTTFNENVRQLGFMGALAEQAPAAHAALSTIATAFKAIIDVVKLIPPELIPLAGMTAVIGRLSKITVLAVNGFVALHKAAVGLSVIDSIRSAWLRYNEALTQSIALGKGWSATMLSGMRALVSPAGAVAVALAGLGLAALQYKRGLDQAKVAQEAVVGGAKTLVTSLGGQWVGISEQARTATAQIQDFAEQNRAAVGALRSMAEESQRTLLFTYAVEMQVRGFSQSDVQGYIDKLVDAAGLEINLPIGIDAAATMRNMRTDLASILPEMERAITDVSWRDKPNLFNLWMPASNDFSKWKTDIDAIALSLSEAAKAGEWPQVIESFAAMKDYPTVLREVTREFGDLQRNVKLSTGSFTDFADIASILADDINMAENVRKAWETVEAALYVTGDLNFALEAGKYAYDKHTEAMRGNTDASDDNTQAKLDNAAATEAAAEAAKRWGRELEQQYDMGSALSQALQQRQKVMNDAAAAQNTAAQKAAEAERRAIDARVAAQIKGIDRVRDARLAELKEQEKQQQQQLSVVQDIGNVLAIQISEDRIRAIQNEQSAVSAAAETEKEALRERAQAQKDAIEAVKVSAGEARLTLEDISHALEAAARDADQYMVNLAQLPEKVRDALLDSGLTPEQKRQLAEELVAGSPSDRERAFEALRTMAERRNEQAVNDWVNFSAKQTEIANKTGVNIGEALAGGLTTGGKVVRAAVQDYAKDIMDALNPILKALGKDLIVPTTGQGRVFGLGIKAPNLLERADGGFLPDQAVIQQPVGTRGLVQWAEPETKGEAFIPLAPEKRGRSIDIWAQTGRLLGVFASGGILGASQNTLGMSEIADALYSSGTLKQPTLLPVTGDPLLSLAHAGNVAMTILYESALDWMKNNEVQASLSYSGTKALGNVGGLNPIFLARFNAWADFIKERYGIRPRIGSGYRSIAQQAQLYAGYLARKKKPPPVAPPGRSWHNYGLAIDYTPAQSRFNQHLGQFGLYLPMSYEPWHIQPRGFARPYADGGIRLTSYDKGGLLKPGLTLAYNGTGRDEIVAKMADGGLYPDGMSIMRSFAPGGAGFANFEWGTKTLTYSKAVEAEMDRLVRAYTRATAAAKTYAGALEMLQATGAPLTEQIAALNNQIAATTSLRNATYEMMKLARAAGATDEQLADARQQVYGFESQLANLRRQLEELTRVPLKTSLEQWANAAAQLQMQMDLVSHASNALQRMTAILPELMGSMHAQFNINARMMREATLPEDIMGFGTAALNNLSQMFSIEQGIINRTLSDTTQSISDAQDAWEREWRNRTKTVEEAAQRSIEATQNELENLQKAQRLEVERLEQYYKDKLRALQDGEREITREQQRNKALKSIATLEDELRILRGQGYYTEADIQRMRELETQIQEQRDDMAQQEAAWAREDEITRLEREREAQLKSLEQQQEAARTALEAQIKAQQEALKAETDYQQAVYDERMAYYDRLRRQAEIAAQNEIDALVTKYQQMMQEVIDAQNELLGQQAEYGRTGYALGQQFAQGLIDALPLIQEAARQVAQTAADYLELHSPAKKGPLSSIDTWWNDLVPSLVTSLDTAGPSNAAVRVANAVRAGVVTRQTRHDEHIWLHINPDAAEVIDINQVADLVTARLHTKVKVAQWSHGG